MLPLLIIIYIGGIPLIIATSLISIIGITEFFRGFENKGIKPNKILSYILIIILYGAHALVHSDFDILSPWIFIATASTMIWGWKIEQVTNEDVISTIIGLIYLVWFPYHVILVSESNYNMLVWIIFIAAFGSDSMAYFTGYAIGKHKLCPNLSPKKTIEGAVGGAVGAGILSGIFAYFTMNDILVEIIILGTFVGILSQAGDLSASAFKRKMGIKDYGHLIPGHGGIMDRFDSIIFVAPPVYYYIIFVIGN